MIWDKMGCIDGGMVKSNIVISLVPYFLPFVTLSPWTFYWPSTPFFCPRIYWMTCATARLQRDDLICHWNPQIQYFLLPSDKHVINMTTVMNFHSAEISNELVLCLLLNLRSMMRGKKRWHSSRHFFNPYYFSL